MHEPRRGGNKQSTDETVMLYKTQIRQNIFVSAHGWCDDAEIR